MGIDRKVDRLDLLHSLKGSIQTVVDRYDEEIEDEYEIVCHLHDAIQSLDEAMYLINKYDKE